MSRFIMFAAGFVFTALSIEGYAGQTPSITCPDGSVYAHSGNREECRSTRGSKSLNGPFVVWSPGGNKKEEGTYNDGKKEGKWSEYDDKGRPKKDTEYKDGKQHGAEHHYRDGVLTNEYDYELGRRTKEVEFYTNGRPRMEKIMAAKKAKGELMQRSKSGPQDQVVATIGGPSQFEFHYYDEQGNPLPEKLGRCLHLNGWKQESCSSVHE